MTTSLKGHPCLFRRARKLSCQVILAFPTLLLENLSLAKCRSRTQPKKQQQRVFALVKIHKENRKILVIKDFNSTGTLLVQLKHVVTTC